MLLIKTDAQKQSDLLAEVVKFVEQLCTSHGHSVVVLRCTQNSIDIRPVIGGRNGATPDETKRVAKLLRQALAEEPKMYTTDVAMLLDQPDTKFPSPIIRLTIFVSV
jgi:hypothetical protein